MNIGSKITELRKQKDWSQADLAAKIEVSRVIVGKYERNEANPSIDVAKRIADAFEVSLDSLVGEGINAQFDVQDMKRLQDIKQLDQSTRKKCGSLLIQFSGTPKPKKLTLPKFDQI